MLSGKKIGVVAVMIILRCMVQNPVKNEYYLAGDSESGRW